MVAFLENNADFPNRMLGNEQNVRESKRQQPNNIIYHVTFNVYLYRKTGSIFFCMF